MFNNKVTKKSKRNFGLKKILKKKSNHPCLYCNSYNTTVNKSLVSPKGNLKEKEFVIECNECSAIGIKKESWYQTNDSYKQNNINNELTDIEISID